MGRKRFPPTDPREWLNRARSNLRRARRTMAGVYLEDLCFDAQQGAEKPSRPCSSIVASCFRMFTTCPVCFSCSNGVALKFQNTCGGQSELTGFAVEARYPGLSGPVTPREHQRAVRIAESILRWAARHIEAR